MKNYRIIAVHAHPDDEASKGAATLAHYAALGHEVLVVTLTGGERGDILNPHFDTPENRSNIIPLRRQEMARSAQILGVRHHWLGFIDSGFVQESSLAPEGSLAAVPLAKAVDALVEVFQGFRPNVVITYQEGGDYPHIDHIRTHQISVGAFFDAALPGPQSWQAAKLYYVHGYIAEKFAAYDHYLRQNGYPNPFERWEADIPIHYRDITLTNTITTRINCSNYFSHREKALLAHQSQIDPNGPFFAVRYLAEKEIWPTEEFQLAYTTIANLSGVKEDNHWISGKYEYDLLAGLDGEHGQVNRVYPPGS